MAGGRPSAYSEEMLDKAKHYLEHYSESPYNNQVPTVFALVGVLGVCRKTIYNWKDPEFLHTLEGINAKQGSVLCDKGLTGDFNPTIAKLMLANQGMSDKVDNTLTGADGGPVQITSIEIVAPQMDSEE